MLAYTICCKDIGLFLGVLGKLVESDIKYDVDPNKFIVYITETESVRIGSERLRELLIPRKITLRSVSYSIVSGKIQYGESGSGLSFGTKELLERLPKTYAVKITQDIEWYPSRNYIYDHRYCIYERLEDLLDMRDSDGVHEVLETIKLVSSLIKE